MQREEVVSSSPTHSKLAFLVVYCGAGCNLLSPDSSRNYTVPDPPGLFDGHVWPMYLKHKTVMEESGVDVGKCSVVCRAEDFYLRPHLTLKDGGS